VGSSFGYAIKSSFQMKTQINTLLTTFPPALRFSLDTEDA